MAPHSSTLAWKIPWMEEPGRLQSMGSRRVRHNWVTSLSLFTFMHWRKKWQPTPVSLPGETLDRGAWCYRPWGRKRVGHDSSSKQEQQQVVNIHFLNKISVIIASDFSFSVWLNVFSFSMIFFPLLGSNLESFYKFNWIVFKSFPWEFLLDCWAGFRWVFGKPFTWAPHNSYQEEIWVGFELRSIFLVAKQRHKCRGNLDFTKRF